MEALHRQCIKRRTDRTCDRQWRRAQQELVLDALGLGCVGEIISRDGVARFEAVESV
jgi:hypothetical protein